MDFRAKTMLDVLALDIDEQPEVLRPVSAELVWRLRALAAGVEVDLDQPLPPEIGGASAH